MKPKAERIMTRKSEYGYWIVSYLINGYYFRAYSMVGFTKRDALRQSRQSALKEAYSMMGCTYQTA